MTIGAAVSNPSANAARRPRRAVKMLSNGGRRPFLARVADTPPIKPPRSPFALLPSTRAGRWGAVAIVWALAMTTLSFVNATWRAAPPANRPIKAPADDYVSADSCRSCHPGNYASWHASFHRGMTQLATPENILSKLDGLEKTDDHTDFRVERRGRKHFVRTKPQGAPASAYGQPQEIVMLTGSHNLQLYWLETSDGRTVEQFPFAYIIAEKMWAPMAQSFLVPPGPKRVYSKGDWNVSCINCHVTQGRSRYVGKEKFDSEVSDFGISCEACHSGGREHIAINRDPLRRFAQHWSAGADQTIANPARMDGPTSSLVCGQCHSVWMFDNPDSQLRFSRENGKYRPGKTALDGRWVVQPGGDAHEQERTNLLKEDPDFFRNSYWGDGMVRVTGREYNGTTASPCFKGGKFSCLSCHEMHPAQTDAATLEAWRTTDQMKPGMESNQACLQCHKDKKLNVAAHTHHAADSSGSSCYNCHMPHTSFGLLRAIRSHQISSPSVRESTELGRPNACNLCHLDQPLSWTAEKLADWYGQKAPALSRDDRELSASVQWLLKGDAGQRALVTWSMGWEPAQKASGKDWLYPFVIFQLNDPYAAVRFGAWKSLQSLPGFAGYGFDYTVDDAAQKDALARAYQKWWTEERNRSGVYPRPTLLDPTGMFRQDEFDRLLNQRDHKRVYLVE